MRRSLVCIPLVGIALVAPVATAFGLGLFSRPAHQTSPVAASTMPVDNQNHLYVLDGWGGVHQVGSAPPLVASAHWDHKDVAQSLAIFPDGTGGYVMDGWGGLHPVGVAPTMDSGVYWPHWIGAREIVLAPRSSPSAPPGYLLDADGGIHAFGGAPQVTGKSLWPGQGIR